MSLTITTRPLSHQTHTTRVHCSLTNVRAACISDRAHKNPHCTTAVTSPTKSVLVPSSPANQSSPKIWPSPPQILPLYPRPSLLPNWRGPGWRLTVPPSPHLTRNPPKTWMTRKSLCDILGDAVFYSILETGRSYEFFVHTLFFQSP